MYRNYILSIISAKIFSTAIVNINAIKKHVLESALISLNLTCSRINDTC